MREFLSLNFPIIKTERKAWVRPAMLHNFMVCMAHRLQCKTLHFQIINFPYMQHGMLKSTVRGVGHALYQLN